MVNLIWVQDNQKVLLDMVNCHFCEPIQFPLSQPGAHDNFGRIFWYEDGYAGQN